MPCANGLPDGMIDERGGLVYGTLVTPAGNPCETPTMMTDNIFLKIIDKKIPAKIAYEDELCLAFHDVNPQAPVHVLIVPRKVIATHDDLTEEDRDLLGHLHLVAIRLAKQLGLQE